MKNVVAENLARVFRLHPVQNDKGRQKTKTKKKWRKKLLLAYVDLVLS
jgi:hypothetical protein